MQVVENRMVIDSEWIYTDPKDFMQEQDHGYENIITGRIVSDDDALDYARKSVDQEDMTDAEFVEWFFSGNWVKR